METILFGGIGEMIEGGPSDIVAEIYALLVVLCS
jgi:hypothetical protein